MNSWKINSHQIICVILYLAKYIKSNKKIKTSHLEEEIINLSNWVVFCSLHSEKGQEFVDKIMEFDVEDQDNLMKEINAILVKVEKPKEISNPYAIYIGRLEDELLPLETIIEQLKVDVLI